MQRISAILMSNPAVANVFIIVGSSFTGNGGGCRSRLRTPEALDERRRRPRS
jgi:hypothetical protein